MYLLSLQLRRPQVRVRPLIRCPQSYVGRDSAGIMGFPAEGLCLGLGVALSNSVGLESFGFGVLALTGNYGTIVYSRLAL